MQEEKKLQREREVSREELSCTDVRRSRGSRHQASKRSAVRSESLHYQQSELDLHDQRSSNGHVSLSSLLATINPRLSKTSVKDFSCKEIYQENPLHVVGGDDCNLEGDSDAGLQLHEEGGSSKESGSSSVRASKATQRQNSPQGSWDEAKIEHSRSYSQQSSQDTSVNEMDSNPVLAFDDSMPPLQLRRAHRSLDLGMRETSMTSMRSPAMVTDTMSQWNTPSVEYGVDSEYGDNCDTQCDGDSDSDSESPYPWNIQESGDLGPRTRTAHF